MFDANGTEGLELFTWIVGGLVGFIAALTVTHFLSVSEEDKEVEEDVHHDNDTTTVVK